jgi:type IV pilus assembly protein PilV
VLAIGLLGMATLMMQSLQSSESAYSRSQASLLAYDIIDRMRANKVTGSKPFHVPHATLSNDYLLASPAACPAPGAGNPNTTGAAKAAADLRQWCALLQASLPNRHTDTRIYRDGSLYTVEVHWQEPTGDVNSVIVEAEL